MATIELRVRNLETDEIGNAAFESERDAIAWLRARPHRMEVLGPATPMSDDVAGRLRAAMRPLDADERALVEATHRAAREAVRAQAEEERRRADEAVAEARRAAAADPDRPLRLRWTYDGGLTHAEVDDARPISPEVHASVLAWVRERDEWVRDRGQMVGDATCTVVGGEVVDGRFVPVTAVAKPTN